MRRKAELWIEGEAAGMAEVWSAQSLPGLQSCLQKGGQELRSRIIAQSMCQADTKRKLM
jgi:hypothetical protein